MKTTGVTLVELLIALAVMGVAFSALLMSQLGNLKASSQSRFASDVKAEATQVLEQRMAEVLLTETVTPNSGFDDIRNGTDGRSYRFTDYYNRCGSATSVPASPPTGRGLRNLDCSGSVADGPLTTTWTVVRDGTMLGEGALLVTVTSRHAQGQQITMVNRVTCYDVYPSPTSDTPAPCPAPASATTGGS